MTDELLDEAVELADVVLARVEAVMYLWRTENSEAKQALRDQACRWSGFAAAVDALDEVWPQ